LAIQSLLDHGLRETKYLAAKKRELAERSERAAFAVPEPPF
jgi:hypothetical protein